MTGTATGGIEEAVGLGAGACLGGPTGARTAISGAGAGALLNAAGPGAGATSGAALDGNGIIGPGAGANTGTDKEGIEAPELGARDGAESGGNCDGYEGAGPSAEGNGLGGITGADTGMLNPGSFLLGLGADTGLTLPPGRVDGAGAGAPAAGACSKPPKGSVIRTQVHKMTCAQEFLSHSPWCRKS